MLNVIFEKEANQQTIDSIYKIAQDYTQDYFTLNLPNETKNDLKFQRVMYLVDDNGIVSFIIFTCWDGSPNITLMATKREYSGKGFGKILLQNLIDHLAGMGFNRVELFTVPPEAKPIYKSTVAFYERMGFKIEKEYSQLWESGAIKMTKTW